MLISPQTYVHDISSEEESIYSEELKEIQERLEEILVDRSEVEISKYRNSDQYLNDIIDIYFCYRFFYKDEERVDRTQVILNYFVNSGVIGKDTIQKLEKKQIKKLVVDHCNNLNDFETYVQTIFLFRSTKLSGQCIEATVIQK